MSGPARVEIRLLSKEAAKALDSRVGRKAVVTPKTAERWADGIHAEKVVFASPDETTDPRRD